MVNHISSPHYLTFFEEDDQAFSYPRNLALHVEVHTFCSRVCRVLIENGVGLNIILFNMIQKLGMSKFSIDPRRKITIKAYDEVERPSN